MDVRDVAQRGLPHPLQRPQFAAHRFEFHDPQVLALDDDQVREALRAVDAVVGEVHQAAALVGPVDDLLPPGFLVEALQDQPTCVAQHSRQYQCFDQLRQPTKATLNSGALDDHHH